MGTLRYQEMVFIFLLALVLFGPKKLPEIGRTLGKAMTEFRRASNELKTTFEREMRNIEQETGSLKELAGQVKQEINLNDPAPSEWVKIWFYDHPTRPERVHFVATYDPWSEGEKGKYVP